MNEILLEIIFYCNNVNGNISCPVLLKKYAKQLCQRGNEVWSIIQISYLFIHSNNSSKMYNVAKTNKLLKSLQREFMFITKLGHFSVFELYRTGKRNSLPLFATSSWQTFCLLGSTSVRGSLTNWFKTYVKHAQYSHIWMINRVS